ncbi:MAG: arsenate reductase ArsC [Acidimicrobiia bacterium]|nr:arsenate reductase ArsC [Acidimicrobiia bacterium]
MTDLLPVIVFLCVHNAGRSQMAAGFARTMGGDRVRVHSGGSSPAATVNPVVVAAMAEVGIDIADRRPRAWTIEAIRAADVVVTMGCGDECPYVPGVQYEDWPVDDPSGLPLERVREVRDDIRDRVTRLLSRLGVIEDP